MAEKNKTINRISIKLRSEAGASITVALLLFLVCAALSAVILVAATTAAGRMSKVAESDQRYYSVMSAAELLCSELDEKTLSVIYLEGKGNSDVRTDSYTFSKPMNEVTDGDFQTDVGIAPYSDQENPIDDETGGAGNGNANAGNGNANAGNGNANAGNESGNSSTTKMKFAELLTDLYNSADPYPTLTMKVKNKNSENELSPLTVEIEMEDVDKNTGTATLSIKNAVEEGEGEHFIVRAYFSVDVEQKYPPVTKVYIDEDQYRQVDMIKTNETTWHLIRMASSYDVK